MIGRDSESESRAGRKMLRNRRPGDESCGMMDAGPVCTDAVALGVMMSMAGFVKVFTFCGGEDEKVKKSAAA